MARLNCRANLRPLAVCLAQSLHVLPSLPRCRFYASRSCSRKTVLRFVLFFVVALVGLALLLVIAFGVFPLPFGAAFGFLAIPVIVAAVVVKIAASSVGIATGIAVRTAPVVAIAPATDNADVYVVSANEITTGLVIERLMALPMLTRRGKGLGLCA